MDALDLPAGVTLGDERRRQPGEEPGWAETWYFDFATPEAEVGGYVQVTFLPHRRTCWYWAWVVGPGRPPVMVVDHHVPLPAGRSLELRTDGLWADHTVEVPFDHMTLGCEAFALRLDDPRDALAADPVGDRIPFGLDLEWDTDGPIQAEAAGAAEVADPPALSAGYAIPCRVHGEVLIADERLVIDRATGDRRHAWGPDPVSVATGLDVDGSSRRVEVLALAPVLVPTGDGRSAPVTRALCRYVDATAAGAGAGAGWVGGVAAGA